MRRYRRYDREYDDPFRSRYPRSDYGGEYRRRYGPYDEELGRFGAPFPGIPGAPYGGLGWGPPIGWAGWGAGMEFWPYAGPAGYGFDGSYRSPRRPPRQSPAYGEGGDRALRRWAQRYGYDFQYAIRPRGRRGR